MRHASVLCLAVAACGNDPIHHLGDAPPSQALPGIYVTLQNNAIAVFSLDASGDTPPLRTITGPSTMLSLPIGIGVDHQGLIQGPTTTLANPLGIVVVH